jgi:hypothetical protein
MERDVAAILLHRGKVIVRLRHVCPNVLGRIYIQSSHLHHAPP